MNNLIINGVEYTPVTKELEIKKPREWWLEIPGLHNKSYTLPGIYDFPIDGKNTIHVREVLPNTVTITKEDLAKAWDEQLAPSQNVNLSKYSNLFKDFFKALGFEDGE